MFLKTSKRGLEYNIDMTMKYVTLDGLLEVTSNVTSFLTEIKTSDSFSNYIGSSMIVGLLEYIPKIKKDFENRPSMKINMIKKLSYSIGSISSLILSYGYDGINFYITLGLNLTKNFATTFIIDKLNKLHQIDGLSLSIFIGFLLKLPKLCKSFLNKDIINIILSLVSLCGLFGINYYIINKNTEIDVKYLNHNEKIKLNFSSIYSLSIMISNFLVKALLSIGVAGILLNSIVILLIPIIGFLLSNDIHNISENIDKYLSTSEGCIDKQRPGEDRIQYINNIIKKNNFKIASIGVIVYLFTFNILIILGISTNITIYISLLVNSIIQINYSIKSIYLVKKTKNIKLLN